MHSANEPSADFGGAAKDPRIVAALDRHWRRNIRLTLVLLVFWAIAGLGCGVLFADVLNEFTFLGCPLGFWFAQQGAILVFIVLIFFYAARMNKLDRDHGVDE